MDEPTRGIDIGAKRDIYDLMNELTNDGVSIIMVSSELPEVLGMSDRVMVIHEGRVSRYLGPLRCNTRIDYDISHRRTIMDSKALQYIKKLGPLIGLILLFIIISVMNDSFLEFSNLRNLLRQVSINAIIAFGMTFVILTGGIDLSVGSILALSSAVMANLIVTGTDPVLAIVLAAGAGLVLGGINGLVITYGRVAPFIATLATMTIYRGATLVFTDGNPISGLTQDPLFHGFGQGDIAGLQFQLSQCSSFHRPLVRIEPHILRP